MMVMWVGDWRLHPPAAGDDALIRDSVPISPTRYSPTRYSLTRGEDGMALGLTRQRPGDLPVEVTGFVGRERELAELAGLLRAARLVTVTGPGGVGKTRVALRAAAQLGGEFADGACLVELSGLHDPELLPDTVASCLGLPGAEAQLDAILEHLRDQRLLLILDTCEHLIDACAMFADVLLRATRVTVLATSRQPLTVPGEHTCVIPPLPVPEPDSPGAGTGDAVELFARCAAAVVPGFAVTDDNRAAVIRLCRRLDGVPLAIELATVRLRAIPLEQLADRLEDRFRLLTGGRRAAVPHHQTIRAATEWSYDLCSPLEQLLWARLTVFAGSFDVEAVEQVCAGEPLDREDILATLIGLVDKSVLLRVERDGTRYLLLDTIREFGAERLAAGGDQEMVRERHLARYLGLASYLGENPLADDQVPRYRQLRLEHADLRAALEYALAAPGRQRDAAAMAISLDAYWQMSSAPGEGRHWLGKILPRLGDMSRGRALALIIDGYLACLQEDAPDGLAELEEGIKIAEERGDARIRARGYLNLTMALAFAGRYEEAARTGVTAYEGALAAGDTAMLIVLDSHVGYLHMLAGNVEEGLARCRSGLDRLGPDSGERWQQSYLLLLEGICLFLCGDLGPSAQAFRTALAMKHEIADTMGMGYALEGTAWLAAAEQRFTRAAWLLGAADSLRQVAGSRVGSNATVEALHARAEGAARDALGEERYRALHDRGAGYPLAELIRLAADGADDLPPQAGSVAQAGPAAAGPGLTSREREIAALVAEGLSNRQIAERLVISKRTVDAHIEHIYGKLGVSSRVQLASWLRSAPP
jgi:predicted ATPase/DNA-binding CsgD family transcriptional regulator